MKLRSELVELLAGFEKRMKLINIVRCILDYKYPDYIRSMFSDKMILDNVIVMTLLFIKEQTLQSEETCTISGVEQFLDDLSLILPDKNLIDTKKLAYFIIVDVLQNSGVLTEYVTYNSRTESFDSMPIRLLNEEKGHYHLTDDAFDFLFRSKEIESELDYSITRFRMKEYMKRDNYAEALDASRELVNRIRNMKISMDDFLLRCRENMSNITVDQYETVISRIRSLLNDEYKELYNIQEEAKNRTEKLSEAQNQGVGSEEIQNHCKALKEIIDNIALTIREQRSLINKKTSLSESYKMLLRDSFSITRFERMNFDRDIMAPIRKCQSKMGNLTEYFLFMFTIPEFEKQFSVENFYAPQNKIRENSDEEGVDMTVEDQDNERIVQKRNDRFRRIACDFFKFADGKKRFTAGEFVLSLRASDLMDYGEENALPNWLMELFGLQELDMDAWKVSERSAEEPNGELEISWCLEQVPENDRRFKKMIFVNSDNCFTFNLQNGEITRKIDMTDFEIEVMR